MTKKDTIECPNGHENAYWDPYEGAYYCPEENRYFGYDKRYKIDSLALDYLLLIKDSRTCNGETE